MALVAKKPCTFCGKHFFIGEMVPEGLVSDPSLQEKLGVLAIVPDSGSRASSMASPCIYTQEQAEHMIEEAIEEAVNNTILEMEQKQKELQQAAGASIRETAEGFEILDKAIPIAVDKEDGGGNAQNMAIPAMPEEIQQVFSVMQMNAEEGAKAITGIENENVLILLHAADSRKTIKDAAKKQADKLFSTANVSSESTGGNEPISASMEGVDA